MTPHVFLKPRLVEPYNPEWPHWFEKLERYFLDHLEDRALRIEHVGDTSVPGLTAKPIIDLDIVIRPGTFDQVKKLLEQAGYEHEGDKGIPTRDAFKPIDPDVISSLPKHHTYVCPSDSPELERHLVFRNFLRQSPDYVQRLGEFKWNLCIQHDNDRQAYIDGKAPFCAEIRRQALLALPEAYCPPTLGLRRHTVRLVHHELEWGRVFENEEKLLRWHIDDSVDDIQHVGSTSVPCLIAKPIIDIGIAIPARERFEKLKDRMVQIGYIYRGDRGNNGG